MARREAQALCVEGDAFVQQKKWDEAIKAFRAAVAKDPEMSDAWFAIGYAEYARNGQKHTEASLEAYEHCAKLDPKHARARNNLGVALKDVREDFDQAEAMYHKAIELDPKRADVHWNLSVLLEKRANSSDGASSSSWMLFCVPARDDLEDAIHETRECVRLGHSKGDARLKRLLAKQAT